MSQILVDELTDRILSADSSEIHTILDAVKERFSQLFPDHELLLLSAPCDPELQIAALQKAISILSSAQ